MDSLNLNDSFNLTNLSNVQGKEHSRFTSRFLPDDKNTSSPMFGSTVMVPQSPRKHVTFFQNVKPWKDTQYSNVPENNERSNSGGKSLQSSLYGLDDDKGFRLPQRKSDLVVSGSRNLSGDEN